MAVPTSPPDLHAAHPAAALWPLDPAVLHCNHGSFGAVPIPVREAQRALRDQIDRNPNAFFRRDLEPLMREARRQAAEFVDASDDGFAFVRNVTEGMTLALAAIGLSEGDELLITDHVYAAVRIAAAEMARRSDAVRRTVALPLDDDDSVVTALLEAIRPSTRAVVIDHIAAPQGRLMPLRAMVDALRSADVAVIVDAAHAPGQVDVDVDGLGADVWIANFHKWLCAPHGSAGIWVAPQWRDQVRPLVISHDWELGYPDALLRYGTDDPTAPLSVPAAIALHRELGGVAGLAARQHALAEYGADLIAAAMGTQRVPGETAWMASAWLPAGVLRSGAPGDALQRRISAECHAEVAVNPVGAGHALRISAFVYNRAEDFEQLAERLGALFA